MIAVPSRSSAPIYRAFSAGRSSTANTLNTMPLTLDFSGKLVCVTGGGRGIGWAITEALAKAGADVAITYTSTDPSAKAEALSREHGVRVQAFKCEVTQSSEVDSAVEEVQRAYGREIDIGIANAGVALWRDAHANSDAEFERIFAVNTFGPYYFARALMRAWLGLPIPVGSGGDSDADEVRAPRQLGKQLLFVSSISALVAMSPQKQAAYNASKAAVTMLCKSLAGEWAHLGVAVNSISPGYVETDMIANPPEDCKGWVEEWKARTPTGTFAKPEDIGEMVACLVSSRMGGMGFMTGSDVVVDGGYTIF